MHRILGLIITAFVFVISSCTAGDIAQTSISAGGAGGVFTFDGVKKIEANRDGTYTISWVPIIGAETIRYAVYSRNRSEQFDFNKPIATTERSFYITEDLRLVGDTCYVVRYEEGADSVDDNTREMCTGNEPFDFGGIQSLIALRDESYMLRWEDVGFDGAIFNVFERPIESVEWKLIGQTNQNFFKTNEIPLDDIRCYRVLHAIEGFPEDDNQAEKCTTSRTNPGAFVGINRVSSPEAGTVKIEWQPSDLPEVVGYNVYLGTDFTKKAAFVDGREINETNIKNLLHAVVYTFGVRAVDQYGREDSNEAIISFELQNHLPVISKLELIPMDASGKQIADNITRPTTLVCKAEYSDLDDWQTLTPTFDIKNNKRGSGDDLTERIRETKTPNTKEYVYKVIDTDDRADGIICSVTIDDGFDNSIEVQSEPYLIPDTKVIATGLELTTLENKSIEITLTRGENKGYTDEDNDIALDILYSVNENQGSIVDIDDNPLAEGGFDCNEGTCTALFKPKKDFFSADENDKSTWVEIRYWVKTEDNTSDENSIFINVRSIPRALGFDFIAEQDRVRKGLCASSQSVIDSNAGQPVGDCFSDNEEGYSFIFDSYLHNLNGKAERIFFRHPLSENYYGGKVAIPEGVEGECKQMETNYAGPGFMCEMPEGVEGECNQIKTDQGFECVNSEGVEGECKQIDTTDLGFECVIECQDGRCPFNFVPWSEDLSNKLDDEGYYSKNPDKQPSFFGPAKIDYAVEIGGILSTYGSVSIEVLPKLRTLPYKGLTVQNESFNLIFTEGVGYQGSSDEIVIQEIKATNFNSIASFQFNDGAETVNGVERVIYKATIKPLTIPGKDEYFSGKATFDYVVKARDSKGKEFESDVGTAEINFYPKPKATGVETEGVENTTRSLQLIPASSVLDKKGYFHANGDLASKIEISEINTQRGYVDAAGPGATATTLSCDAGTCFVGFVPKQDYFDTSFTNEDLKTFSYQIETLIPQIYLDPTIGWKDYVKANTPAENAVFIDEFLENPENQAMLSNKEIVTIKFRPIPRVKPLTLYTPENSPKRNSSLTIKFNHSKDKNFTSGTYFHPLSFEENAEQLSAIEAAIEDAPAKGSLTPFLCVPGGICEATYTPSYGQVGMLDPSLSYNVTVEDPEFVFGGFKVSSKWEELKIDVRPIPKATGITAYMPENADFLTDPDKNPNPNVGPGTVTFTIAKGLTDGYTHLNNLSAVEGIIRPDFNMTGALLSGDECDPNQSSEAVCKKMTCDAKTGECVSEFTPKVNSVGSLSFTYEVAIDDPFMEENLWSTPGEIDVEVRPLPRTNDIGSPENRLIVHEGATDHIFAIKANNQGYFHQYQIPANAVVIEKVKEGTAQIPKTSCNASGECEIKFTPQTNYEGESYIDFYVEVFDDKLGQHLRSNISRIYIDVYPKPRATDRGIYLLELSSTNLKLELAPKDSLESPFLNENHISDENDDGIYLARKGYAHRRDSNAASIYITSSVPANRGEISSFSCNMASLNGLCDVSYTAKEFQEGTIDSFTYSVTMKDPDGKNIISPDDGAYKISLRPRPRTHKFDLYMTENADFLDTPEIGTITVKNEPDLGYTHALNEKAQSISAVVQSSTLTEGTQPTEFKCNEEGTCTFEYTPKVNAYGKVAFDYSVTVFDELLKGHASSKEGEGVITLDIRPLPRNVDFGSNSNRLIVHENESRTFTISRNENTYIHPYSSIVPTEIVIESFSHSKGEPVTDCEGGICTITFTPEEIYEGGVTVPYEGPAFINYKVGAFDPVVGEALFSDIKTIYIDVYPKPRATGRKAFVLENRAEFIKIELRNRAELSAPFLLESDWLSLEDRKGYTHRRNKAAFLADLGDVPSQQRATIGEFSCNPEGICALSYTPGSAKEDGSVDILEYRIAVKDPDQSLVYSNYNDYEIQVRPAPTAKEFTRATLENEELKIDFKFGEGGQHNHLGGLKPDRIEIVNTSFGNAVIEDKNPESEEINCTVEGTCTVIFTPDTDFYSPDNDLQKAYLTYKLWTYDDRLDERVPSNEAKVFVNVRPLPKAYDRHIVLIQGEQPSIDIRPGTNPNYFYPTGSKFVDSAEVIPGSNANGAAAEFGNCDLNNGYCSTVFTPGLKGDEPYYGGEASFSYKLKVFDPALNRDIESAPANITFDYRPRPKATGKNYTIWQGSSVKLEIDPKLGFDHHYYPAEPDQYKPVSAFVVNPPATGSFLGGLNFDCSQSPLCGITYQPGADYFSNADSKIEIDYRVGINDPYYQDPISLSPEILSANETYWEKPINIDVRPIVVNTGKFDRGVQGVQRTVIIDLDDGYTYPAALGSGTSLQIKVISKNKGEFITSGDNIDMKCEGSRCEGVWKTTSSLTTGPTSFEYKIIQTEEGLTPYESEVATYTIDFYPIPKAISRIALPKNNGQLGYDGKHFIGTEGQTYEVEILPGLNPLEISMLCDITPANPSDTRASYSHELCTPAIKVDIVNGSSSNGMFTTPFSCDEKGVCKATFAPTTVNEDWPGYGLAGFDFNVTIDPPELEGFTLSQDEQNALTSQSASSDIEFFPLPKATGVRISDLSDYIYGIQGNTVTINIERCNDATIDECNKGYVHGYNLDATEINPTISSNVIISTLTGNGPTWTISLRPESDGFYTTDESTLANIKYKVKVADKLSPNEGNINLNIYPVPVATPVTAYGLEGEDTQITIETGIGKGYIHPFSMPAIAILMTSSPEVEHGSFLDPSTGEIIDSEQSSIEELNKAWTCEEGKCVATFRPADGFDGKTGFFFKVLVDGPSDMPQNLKDQLQTGQEAYTINVFPKPTVSTLEFVVIEEIDTTIDLYNEYGYSHPNGANHLTFIGNGDYKGRKLSSTKITVNDETARGILKSSNFECPVTDGGLNCKRICDGGVCSMQFKSNSGIYSKTIAQKEGCSESSSECPEVAFKVTVISETGLIAESVDYATMRFNVRRKPRISNLPETTYVQVEGEPSTLQLSNGENAGYTHPLLNASAIKVETTQYSDPSNPPSFSCGDNAEKPDECTAVFKPAPGFQPSYGDSMASVSYKVKVFDPTHRTDSNDPVGELISDTSGIIKINYRSRPIAKDIKKPVAQDAEFNLILEENKGYSYTFNSDPNTSISAVYIKQSTLDKLEFQNPDELSCTGESEILCKISCAQNICTIPLKARDGEFGEDDFEFKIAAEDKAFDPSNPRELISTEFATATIDIRPRPVAKDLTIYTIENSPVEIKMANPATYSHPYDTPTSKAVATSINIVIGATKGNLGNNFDQACDANGECIDTYTPLANKYGEGSFRYTVTIKDEELDAEIVSYPKDITIDIRPVPDATGFASLGKIESDTKDSNFAIFQDDNRDLVIAWAADDAEIPKGYYYPHDVSLASALEYNKADYNQVPDGISIVNRPATNLVTFGPGDFACSFNDPARECIASITATNTTYGASNLKYKVKMKDPRLDAAQTNQVPENWESSPILTSAASDIYIDVRPVPKAQDINPNPTPGDVTTYPATSFRAIEGETLQWEIKNLDGKGFTYPTSDLLRGAEYEEQINKGLGIVIGNNKLNGIAEGSCSAGSCQGTFTPNAGAVNNAFFEYKLNFVDDFVTASGGGVYQTPEFKTVNIDIYPKPVASNTILFHTIQDQPVTIVVKRGEDLGFTHLRNDNPVLLTTNQVMGGTIAGTQTCENDKCEIEFTPNAGSSSSTATKTDDFFFDYKVDVRETVALPRQARSDNVGRAEVLVYPKPKADAANIAKWDEKTVWEGEETKITLKRAEGLGYTHKWDNNAVKIDVISISDGSVLKNAGNDCTQGTGCFVCDIESADGSCTATLIPKLGTIGASAVSIKYKVITEFDSQIIGATEISSDNEATLEFNVRPVPRADENPLVVTHYKENTEFETLKIKDFDIRKGYGYTYAGDTNAIALRLRDLTNATCSGCTIDENTLEEDWVEHQCVQEADYCRFEDITPSLNFNRTNGDVTIGYQIKVKDDVSQEERWSNWGDVKFKLIPRAKGQSLTRNDASERNSLATNLYTLSLTTPEAYTHPENITANVLVIDPTSAVNIASVSSDNQLTCPDAANPLCDICPADRTCIQCSAASCQVDIKMKDDTHTYDQIADYTEPSGDGYGWTELPFQVNVPVNDPGLGQDINFLSTPGTAHIYVRPLPKGTGYTLSKTPTIQKDNAIAGEIKNVRIALESNFNCAPNACKGYWHVSGLKAISISVDQPSSGLSFEGAATCDAATGNCDVPVKAMTGGTYTFQYNVTVADNIGNLLQKEPTTATINFVDRPVAKDVASFNIIEGQIENFGFARNTKGYEQADQTNLEDVIISVLPTALSLSDKEDNVCPGESNSCNCFDSEPCIIKMLSLKGNDWPNAEDSYTDTISFKVRDNVYQEVDGSPLISLDEATLNVNVKAMVKATGKDYTTEETEGIEGVAKSISLDLGDGYTNELGTAAASIKILQANGVTHSCSTGCPCSNGKCNFTVSPLSGANFEHQASFTYQITDTQGYKSHKPGTVNVNFYLRPKMTEQSITVAENSGPQEITINLDSGYIHQLGDKLSNWDTTVNSAKPKYNNATFGQLSGFSCNIDGQCKVTFTPPSDKYTGTGVNRASFSYKGWIQRNGNNIESVPTAEYPGVFYIEVFPKPVAQTKTIHWVQDYGDMSKQSDRTIVTIKKGEDYTSSRGDNPTSINIVSSTNGTLGSWNCSQDTCSAPVQSLQSSASSTEIGASFEYQVITANKEDFPSNKANINFIVMPKADLYEPTVDIKQDETIQFKIGKISNIGNRQYRSFSHPWGDVGILDFEIYDEAKDIFGQNAGNLTKGSCTATECAISFDPKQEVTGNVTFKYRMKIGHPDHATNNLSYWTDYKTVTLRIEPLLQVTGVNVVTEWGAENPKTTNFTIQKGAEGSLSGYTHLENKTVNGLKLLSISTNAVGKLYYGSQHIDSFPRQLIDNSGSWILNLKSDPWQFGEVFIEYQVCDLSGPETNCDQNVIKSERFPNQKSKWLRVFLEPSDVPPQACNNKVIQAYNGQQRKISFARGLDSAQCHNGDWWYDADNNAVVGVDEIVAVYITGTGSNNFIPANDETTCANGNDGYRVCSCTGHSNHSGEGLSFADLQDYRRAYAGCNLEVYYTPGANDVSFQYKTVTHSAIIGQNGPDYHSVSDMGSFTIDVVPIPTPVAMNLVENPTYEDQAVDFKLRKGAGWLSSENISGSGCIAEPDGCPMLVDKVSVVSYSTSDFTSVNFTECKINTAEIYECTVNAEPYADKTGAISFNFTVTANGKTSANATATMNVPSQDDPPNTYKNGIYNTGVHRYLFMRGESNSYYPLEGSFYTTKFGDTQASGEPIVLKFHRWTGDPYRYRGSIWRIRHHGYFDVDGDPAKEIRVSNIQGGTIEDNPIPCDASGVCTTTFTPTGKTVSPLGHDWGNRSFFDYVVVSSNNDAESPQSRAYIEVVGQDPAISAQHKPYNDVTAAQNYIADVSPDGFEQEYVVGQDKKVRFSVVAGVDYFKEIWRNFPRTDRASHIEFKNPQNISIIKDAETNTHCTQQANGNFYCTCLDGKCFAYFTADKDYPEFPQTATVDYRLIANDGYNCKDGQCVLPNEADWKTVTGGFDFYGRLKTASEWKKITYKVTANGLGKYLDPPELIENLVLSSNGGKTTAPGEAVQLTIGDGLALGGGDDDIYYSHPAQGADWQPLKKLHILETSKNITVDGCGGYPCPIACTDGVCENVTFRPANNEDGSVATWGVGAGDIDDRNFQAVVWIEAEDNWGGKSDPVAWHFNNEPAISVRDICVFDYEDADKRSCFRSNYSEADTAVGSGEKLTIKIRKKQDAQNIRDYSAYEYSTADAATKATRLEISNFSDVSLFKNGLPSGIGINCDIASQTCSIDCDPTTGDCQFDIEIKEGITDATLLTFDYQVFSGDTASNATWPRWAASDVSDNLGLGDKRWSYKDGGKGRYEIKIKPLPGIPDPKPSVDVALGTQKIIKLGAENDEINSIIKGFTYNDTAILEAEFDSVEFFKLTNDEGNIITRGDISNNRIDSINQIGLFTYNAPSILGDGKDQIGYRVKIWGIEAEGVLDINLLKMINTNDIVVALENSGTIDQTPEVVTITQGQEYTDSDPDNELLAEKIELLDIDIDNISISVPNLGGVAPTNCNEENVCKYVFDCAANGDCSFEIAAANKNILGTQSFKYRLALGNLAGWSDQSKITVDITAVPTRPEVFDMNLDGTDEEEQIIVISSAPSKDMGADYGYFDINQNNQGQRELAVALNASNDINGTLKQNDITCTNGICIVQFTPNQGFYTPAVNPSEEQFAKFNFRVATVDTSDENWSDPTLPGTVKINVVPQIRSYNINTAGVKNVAKTIVIKKDEGLAYAPGSYLITHAISSNATNGTVTSEASCTDGECSFTFTPITDFVGAASFDFELQIRGGDGVTVSKKSNKSTVSINFNDEDQAPIAKDFKINLASRNPIQFNIAKPNHYEDREGDEATALTFTDNPATVTDVNCINGVCGFTFTPEVTYQGEVELKYQVTAGGKASNIATILLNIPNLTDGNFTLAWGDNPSLSNTCQVFAPIVTTPNDYCTGGGATCTITAYIDPAVSSTGATASFAGLSADLTSLTEGTKFLTSFTLEDTTPKTVSMGRYLSLIAEDPQTLRSANTTATPSLIESMEGYQASFDGCLGSSCDPTQKLGAIAVGEQSSCVVMPDSRVMCWGNNSHGQLGNDSATTEFREPQYVKDPANNPGDPWEMWGAASISIGKSHACSLQNNGRVYCWGDDTYGQLGNSDQDTNCADNICKIPQIVVKQGGSALSGIVAISLGEYHSCALNSAGNVYCWGRNNKGQLGDGTTTDRTYADLVKKAQKDVTDNSISATDTLDHIFKISAGGAHTCALYAPTDAEQLVTAENMICWGANDYLQIGDNDYKAATDDLSADSTVTTATAARPYPVLVRDGSASDNPITSVIDISAGNEFTCAVFKDQNNDIKPYCWGRNDNQQTSKAYIEADMSTLKVSSPNGVDLSQTTASPVKIAAGSSHACVLLSDRSVQCWGAHTTSNSILGANGVNNGLTAIEVETSGSNEAVADAQALSLGSDHSCVLKSGGLVACWGVNDKFQIGQNDVNTESSAAINISNGFGTDLMGAYRTCTTRYRAEPSN